MTKQNIKGETTLSYTHYTLEERKYLQELLSQGYSFRKISEYLGRSPSSVSREVKRNKSKKAKDGTISNNKFCYNSWRAQVLSIMRRRNGTRYRLKAHTQEWNYIINGLKRYWSPEEITNRWRIENPESTIFGVSTIYRAIKCKRFPNISRKTHLRRRGKKKQTKDANYNTIQPDRIIPEWTQEIKARKRIGDWEGDTIQGKPGCGMAVTQVDRKSRYLIAKLVTTKRSEETKEAIIEMFKGYPLHSISLDNGVEFALFREIEKELQTPIYFAEPHKPWQRGTNENTNGILRFFFPKGCNFLDVTQQELDYVVDLINNRPRKCLGWKTPAEVFFSECVALT